MEKLDVTVASYAWGLEEALLKIPRAQHLTERTEKSAKQYAWPTTCAAGRQVE